MRARKPRGVLLDVDGTLLDSNDGHARAWRDAFVETGIRADLVHIRSLIGKGGDKVLPEVSGLEEESSQGKAINERKKAIFRERYLPSCRAFPRARALVARMKDEGLAITVATSASADELDALLHAAGVHDLIERATTSSDAERSKPDPDIVAAAARKTRLSADVLIMLGDTPYDVESASRAAIRAVALRCGGWPDPELGGAVAIYDDAADLLSRYDSSPFARAG